MRIRDIISEATLKTDVPNTDWLAGKQEYAQRRGRDRWGVPYMGSTTAWFTGTVQVPVSVLKQLPGMRQEQQNVRKDDLAWLTAHMKKTGKLPLVGEPGSEHEYAPFVMVAHDGSAWVNEGNHRIMAAAALGWKTLPVEVKYFDGGERVESGPMYPGKLNLSEALESRVWLRPGMLRGSYTDQQLRALGFRRTEAGKWWINKTKWDQLVQRGEIREQVEDEEQIYPSVAKAKSVLPQILARAQRDYDRWDESDQDTYAGGGICHIIADSICSVLSDAGINCTPVSCSYEQHVYVAAQFDEGVYSIDIPYHIYETGGGFSWKKLPDIRFDPSDVVFSLISGDPAEFDNYIDSY